MSILHIVPGLWNLDQLKHIVHPKMTAILPILAILSYDVLYSVEHKNILPLKKKIIGHCGSVLFWTLLTFTLSTYFSV